MLKKSFLFIICVLFIIACKNNTDKETSTTKTNINIIPKPLSMESGKGEFSINKNTIIVFDKSDGEINKIADYFINLVENACDFKLSKSNETNNIAENSVFLSLDEKKNDFGDEGYNLNIEEEKIVLTANKGAGIFYGIQTIRQLLPDEFEDKNSNSSDFKIPCVKITDKPRFKWRGLLLDCCRHFMSKDFIKRYIDLLAYHKMNRFHWHLTEDQGWRIEIKKYPELQNN